MDTRTERTIESFMRESDDATNTDGDGVNVDAAASVVSGDAASGDDPALHGDMDSPDARIAQSELSHIFSDLMEPDGAEPEGAAPEAELVKKVSTQMTVPIDSRLYKRSVVSQFNGVSGSNEVMSPDRLLRVCQAVSESQEGACVESNAVGLQTDVAVIFESSAAHQGKYCVWYGRVQRMFKFNAKRKTEYKRPVSLITKPKNLMLKMHWYSPTSARSGAVFKYNHHDDTPVSLECVISTVSFKFEKTNLTYAIDSHDFRVVKDALASCNQLGRVVGINPSTPDMQQRHVVEAVCGRRINGHTGDVEYSLKWKDSEELSWEKEANCSCRVLIREFDASLRE